MTATFKVVLMSRTNGQTQHGRHRHLILLSFILLANTVSSNLFVILLQGGHVLSGLRELSLLHALSDVPVDEGPLGVHEVELVVQASPGLCDGGGVAQHAHGPLHLGQVSTRNHRGGLVVDAHLEACGAPVHKLDGTLGLDGGDGRVDVFGHHVSTVQEAAGHVLAVTRVAFHHLIGWLEAGVCDVSHRELLVIRLLCRDNWSIGGQREVDTRVGHQVGLELCQVDVQGAIEAQGGGDGGHDLSNQPVEVGVGGALNVQVPAADVIDGLIVYHEGAVRVLQGGVGGQDGVVGLHHGSGHLRSWVNRKLQLGLFAVVDRETLHQQRSEA